MNEQSITLPPGIDFREPGQPSPYERLYKRPVFKQWERDPIIYTSVQVEQSEIEVFREHYHEALKESEQ